ncbi:hypothetical protein [Fusobacterium sp. PH5-44]|uniref:hypothetical protein n=1 Tax=unclassified Fusobacterium TaxID=2648384 RepID=UPI003D1D2807
MTNKKEIIYLNIRPFQDISIGEDTYNFDENISYFDFPSDKINYSNKYNKENGEIHIKGGFLCFENNLITSISSQKLRETNWVIRINNTEINGTQQEKILKLKELYKYEEVGELIFFPEIGIRTYKIFIDIYSKDKYDFARSFCQLTINPLKDVKFHNKTYTLGDSFQSVSTDQELISQKIDYTIGYMTALLGSTKFIFRQDNLTGIFTNFGTTIEVILGDNKGILSDMLPILMKKYNHSIIKEYPADSFNPKPGLLCHFPELGILMSDRRELTIGIQEEVNKIVNTILKYPKTYKILPYEGYINSANRTISLGTSVKEVDKIDGLPKTLSLDANVMKQTKQVRDEGIRLYFKHNELDSFDDAQLEEVIFLERDSSIVFLDNIEIFLDKKLEKLKSKYEYKDSEKKMSTLFPTLGLYITGCGEKKNNKEGAEGKLVTVFSKNRLLMYERRLKME